MFWKFFAFALLLLASPPGMAGWASIAKQVVPAGKYPALANGTPGTECAALGQARHFLWHGECRYDYAYHAENVSASSEYPSSGATYAKWNATDGSLTSYMITKDESAPWWEIDLGERVWVDELVIMNRTDCCGERLNGAMVALSETVAGNALMFERSNAVHRYQIGSADAAVSIKPGVYARHIRIYIPRKEFLQLKEVAVLGNACNCRPRWVRLPDIPVVQGHTKIPTGWGHHKTVDLVTAAGASDISVGNGEVYVSRGGDGAVFRWHQSQRHWTKMEGWKSVGSLAIGRDYNLPLEGTTGNEVSRLGPQGKMEAVGGSFGSAPPTDITYTQDGKLFAGGVNNGSAYFWEYVPGNPAKVWVNGPGGVWRLDGTWVHSNELWALGPDQSIWKRTGSGWKKLSGRALDVGVGYLQTWVIGMDAKPWRYETISGKLLGQMPGANLARIAVTSDGDPWTVKQDGSVWAWCEHDNTRNLLGDLCPKE